MPQPVFLVIAENGEVREGLSADPRHRFAGDYLVVDAASPVAALTMLTDWARASQEVTLLIADERLTEIGAVEFLTRAHELHPAAKRVLLVGRGDWSSTHPAISAIAQGAFVADLATDPRFDGPCPVLLMGDLNAAVDSPVLRPVRDVLTDAWSAGRGPADAVTLPSSHPSAPLEAGPQLIDQRIDHVFFRPGREDQQVLVEGVHLAGERSEASIPPTTGPSSQTCVGAADTALHRGGLTVQNRGRVGSHGCR
jgi:hypothetical protein